MFGRTTVLFALVLALALPASASARPAATSAKAPTGLKAFLLRYDEPAKRNFSRTPSLGWKPVPQAMSYDVQLSTSTTFRENSIIWSASALTTPYAAVSVALPWTTGHPYSLFARVRAHKQKITTNWSAGYGFNVRWSDVPAQMSAPNGLLRWTPIDGASAYEVWESGSGAVLGSWVKTSFVSSNVTDMRDWFTFHQTAAWVGNAFWRVRAVRLTYGTLTNGQPTTSYGAWSPVFVTHATPPSSTSALALSGTASDVLGTVSSPVAHEIMPGFAWSGTVSRGASFELYRAYVFSDADCIEPVLTGSIVGSPAWVPRLTGPLALPTSPEDVAKSRSTILVDGSEGSAYDYARSPVKTSESASTGDSVTSTRLDLWDREWPSGAYYWTVVPVTYYKNSLKSDAFEYQDTESAQDACSSGRVSRFGRSSQAVPTAGKSAYVTSLSLAGKMKSIAVNRAPSIYGSTPLVTWTPALGADTYEVQWGHSLYPFRMVGSVSTAATSALLSLAPGTWYYRVRGVDLSMPSGAQGMAWSSVRKLKIVKPSFRISR
jgi:hypothetical protein